MELGLLAPLFIVGLICAASGWGMVRISARIERQRALDDGDNIMIPATNLTGVGLRTLSSNFTLLRRRQHLDRRALTSSD